MSDTIEHWRKLAASLEQISRGEALADQWTAQAPVASAPRKTNQMEDFFNARKEGWGIWKWRHYFDIYERHFSRFRGTEVNILEVGVYSGGSLDMWRDYFGPKARLFGMDIQPACKIFERDGTQIMIGDQGDRDFWRQFREQVPQLDIVIDDGSHIPEHQSVTMEELLPHLRPGGVFLCEDVHHEDNAFTWMTQALTQKLNYCAGAVANADPERSITSPTSAFQSAVGSVHFYPFITVIERNAFAIPEFVAAKHGTQWL